MKSITKQKPFEEIVESLDGFESVYIIGCGTCTTMTRTGGREEVIAMKDKLIEAGKIVTGWVVIPMACDEMTETLINTNNKIIQSSDCLLIMSCALGTHKVSEYINKPVIPGTDTLFIGLEYKPGFFHEVCAQCGQCIIGYTAGICPITACHKGLLNGPCGGTNNGKCEVDKEKDCAWTLIYERLASQNRLHLMRKYLPPKNNQAVPRPKSVKI
jgi:ferredoxin